MPEDIEQVVDPEPVEPEGAPEDSSPELTPEVGEPQEPAPTHITQEAFENAIQGITRQMQDNFHRSERRFEDFSRRAQAPQPPPQQQPTRPQFPDPYKFMNMEPYDLHQNLAEHFREANERAQVLETELGAIKEARRQEKEADNYHAYLKNQVDTAVDQNPLFQKPGMRDVLERQVYSAMHENQGDFVRVNIPHLAKSFGKQIEDMAKEMAKAQQGIGADGKALPPKTPPGPKGAPTEPTVKYPEKPTAQEFEQAQEQIIRQLRRDEE